MKRCLSFMMLSLLILSFNLPAKMVQNYLFIGSSDLSQLTGLLKRDDFKGVQIVYNWKSLEKAPNEYDFSQIESDLATLRALHKKLFIQIQDRFFEPKAKNIPLYLQQDPIYKGGLVPQFDNPGENQPEGNGWVAQQWNPHVQARFQKLLTALAKQFDGRIAGINLPETAIDLDSERDNHGFSCDNYFKAEMENIQFARRAFKHSYVIQFVNFWPCEWENDHHYMSRLFAMAAENKIGLGGPDIVPFRKGQMKNSYPFFNQYKGKLDIVAFAIQEPTLTYINPKTKHPFTYSEFINFAQSYLGVDIIFWSPHAPWIKHLLQKDG